MDQQVCSWLEVSETAHQYIEQKKGLKESLIIQNRRDLLGDMAEIQLPKEMPMDYHVFEIREGKGRMDIDIDFKWDILGCSYSGNKKEMKKLREISKEIYLYYGVTQEDIANQTRRYKELVGALSAD